MSCLLVAELKALQAEEILAFLPRKVELRAVRSSRILCLSLECLGDVFKLVCFEE